MRCVTNPLVIKRLLTNPLVITRLLTNPLVIMQCVTNPLLIKQFPTAQPSDARDGLHDHPGVVRRAGAAYRRPSPSGRYGPGRSIERKS